jgi:hypothetical protein
MQEQPRRLRSVNSRRYVPRYAGEAFASDSPVNQEGSDYRRLLSTEAWKAPPSASIQID